MSDIMIQKGSSIQCFETLNSNTYSVDGNVNSFRNYNPASSLNSQNQYVDMGSLHKNKQKIKLKQKVNDQNNVPGYSSYSPYQIPPNWKLADIHRDATAVGQPKKQFNMPFRNNQVCPCCGFQINKKQINMMDDYTILSFLGSGYPLFFSFTKYCVYIIVTILLTSGSFNLWTNYKGKNCLTSKQIKQGLPMICSADYISTLTIINKANDPQAMALQNILDFITIFLLMILCVFYRTEQKQIDYNVDAEEITPADYTIMIKGVPKDMSEQELKEQLRAYREDDEENNDPLKVSDITYIYNVKHIQEINKKIKILVKQKQKALADFDENSQVFANIQNEWDDKIYYFLLQSQSYLKCVQDDKTQFTGYAFVSFEYEDDKQYVLQSIDKTLFESIKDYFFSAAPEYKELTLKKTNTLLQMTESPEPLDIIWDNLTMNDQDKLGIRKVTFYSTIAITSFCAYIIYLLNQYQNENSIKNDNDDDDISIYKEIMEQLSFNSLITSAAIIFINSFIINFSFAYFVKLERYNTRTQYNVQLAKKLTIALFINSALVITFISVFVTKNVYKKAGLIYNTFYYFVIDTFLSFVSTLVDEEYYFYLVRRWWYSRKGSKSRLTQSQANEIYQYPKHEIEMCYAELMNGMYICVFFSSAVPIGLIFQLISIVLYYWITKYLLIRQKRVNFQISAALSLEMTNFLEMLIPVYAISAAIFSYTAGNSISTLQIITIAISVLFSAVPVQVILENVIEFDIQVEEISYSKAIFQFASTFKKEDPFSSFNRRYFSRRYRNDSFVELN